MVQAERSYRRVSPLVLIGRSVVAPIVKPALKAEIVPQDGLTRAAEFAEQGYGNLFLFTHISYGEAPRFARILISDPVFRSRGITAPFSVHSLKEYYKVIAGITGITFCPIVTLDTVKYAEEFPKKSEKYREALSKQGAARLLNNYLANEGPAALKRGASLIMYPQGGRDGSLEKVTSATSTLVNRTTRYGIDRYAITFIAVGIKGVKDYKDPSIRRINLGQEYQFFVGRTLTKMELLEEAQARGGIDTVTLEELRIVSPSNYLPKKP